MAGAELIGKEEFEQIKRLFEKSHVNLYRYGQNNFFWLFKICNFISTEIEWIPLNNVEISKERNESLINFFDSLEEDEDVQNFYSNAKFDN